MTEQKKAWRYALSIKKKVKELKRKPCPEKAKELLPKYLEACEALKENPNEKADYYILLTDMINSK